MKSCILILLALVLSATAETKPVSFHKEIVPIFKRSCNGCHHPAKLKGELDMTSMAGLLKGGKNGAAVVASDPKKSLLIEEISGDEPSMPKEGEPLSKAEVALIERWIKEGATDDTPAELANPFKLGKHPEYTIAPVISAMAYSPDGKVLAVSGYHEILLHKADGSGLITRLLGESPRIESLAFSADGKLLIASGGAPARFGEIQIWDAATHKQIRSVKSTFDTLYGVSISPDSTRIAFGCADKTVRMISVADGKELLKFENHSDWVFGTTFTTDGKRVLSGSRDKAMKLIDAASGQFIDDVNKLLEPVLCISRHPKENQIAYGGDMGTVRAYRMSDNQGRTAANNDVNQVREYERQAGPVQAIAFGADGSRLAAGGSPGEVRIYSTSDGKRMATLKGHSGPVFSIAFHPQRKEVATGGYDGYVRLFNVENGNLVTNFFPVPLSKPAEKLTAAR